MLAKHVELRKRILAPIVHFHGMGAPTIVLCAAALLGFVAAFAWFRLIKVRRQILKREVSDRVDRAAWRAWE
jgi:hypothetical protein